MVVVAYGRQTHVRPPPVLSTVILPPTVILCHPLPKWRIAPPILHVDEQIVAENWLLMAATWFLVFLRSVIVLDYKIDYA
jgi:hypothetical protein